MRHISFLLAPLCTLSLVYCQSASAITVTTVPVGNPGNGNDTNTGSLYGEVDYNYAIGKDDVTVGQYTAFLNAVAATDTYGLYNSGMATDGNVAGIVQNGSSGNYTYNVIGSPNHPIVYVSLYDAARFANWLANGQPTGVAEDNGTTETGSYTLNGSNPSNLARNASATWVIPTENEWYKAAYYDPSTSSYYQYGLSSNTPPTSAPPVPGTTPNTGNFFDSTTGYAVTGSLTNSSTQNYLTDVGAYLNSASPYGAYDMAGDVFQWEESSRLRGARGPSSRAIQRPHSRSATTH